MVSESLGMECLLASGCTHHGDGSLGSGSEMEEHKGDCRQEL